MYDDHMNLCKLYMLQFRHKFFVKTVVHTSKDDSSYTPSTFEKWIPIQEGSRHRLHYWYYAIRVNSFALLFPLLV